MRLAALLLFLVPGCVSCAEPRPPSPLPKPPTPPAPTGQSLLEEGSATMSRRFREARPLPPLDPRPLEPKYEEDWNHRDFTDDEVGVTLKISRGGSVDTFGSFSATTQGLGKDKGKEGDREALWTTTVSSRPEATATLHLKLAPKTLNRVIADARYPLFARYVALRDMLGCPGLGRDDWVEIIERTARDPSAELRVMAMNKANDLGCRDKDGLARVLPVCVRALDDPCTDVFHAALPPIVAFFDFRVPKTGQPYSLDISFSGPPSLLDLILRERATVVARSVHAVRPDFLPAEDLARILRNLDPAQARWKK